MAHIGFICTPIPSHVSCLSTLARQLQIRGHRITFFGIPDLEGPLRQAGFGFCPIGATRYPVGTAARLDRDLSHLIGFTAFRFALRRALNQTEAFLDEGPEAIRNSGIASLVLDRTEGAGPTIAAFLQVPFVTITLAVPGNPDLNIPPSFTGWRYRPTPLGRLRNRLAYQSIWYLMRPYLDVINRAQARWNIGATESTKAAFGEGLAEIAQMPACFDYPREDRSSIFHYTGPFMVGAVRQDVPFPWERITDKQLVYGALGNVMAQETILRAIAEACEGLDVQLVLSIGQYTNLECMLDLPGTPVVVRYAPQLELIKRSALVITHAGLNTTLEALWCGVPLVAIPIALDQPAVAARVKWAHVGEVVPARRASGRRLRMAIRRVLGEPEYRKSAQRLQRELRMVDGLNCAANIVENALTPGKLSR